ncbi:uncharacterized protein LOC110983327 [Acanthaster planci]|uniref:Uncharacterized protein LOC110983327 n=1 Tax=Acanthaster planci TaxID=133434 RepID=A0A8B7Z099_ACAPL|nr:uncharacterized protein LOC110983327 [Acanthaster planci]
MNQLNQQWMTGPEFLYLPEQSWPHDITRVDNDEVDKERRKTQPVLIITSTQDAIDCKKFSSWRRLLRVTAYVLRFVHTLQAKKQSNTDKEPGGPLLPREISEATDYWLIQAQKPLHQRVANGEFKMLSPFTDEQGILRVGGRLKESIMTYNRKHPALLPHDHQFSHLTMRNIHESGHNGVATTVAKTRENYWILKAHSLAKTVKYRCALCQSWSTELNPK